MYVPLYPEKENSHPNPTADEGGYAPPEYDDVVAGHMDRSFLLAQMHAPPLPMLCRAHDGSEAVRSSHDLLWVIFGRLVSVPSQRLSSLARNAFRPNTPASAYGGDWRRHVTEGPHVARLMSVLKRHMESVEEIELTGGGGFVSRTEEAAEFLYPHFCAYTRSVISIAMAYDACITCSQQPTGPVDEDGVVLQDVRFASDLSRVSVRDNGSLFASIQDYYIAQIIRVGLCTDAEINAHRRNHGKRMDFRYTCFECLCFLARAYSMRLLTGGTGDGARPPSEPKKVGLAA
jgi:hypothetical protein